MENDVGKLIVWAADIAERIEKSTNIGCSTTKVLVLHGIEKNKLTAKGVSNDEANERAKVVVANNLINGRKQR